MKKMKMDISGMFYEEFADLIYLIHGFISLLTTPFVTSPSSCNESNFRTGWSVSANCSCQVIVN